MRNVTFFCTMANGDKHTINIQAPVDCDLNDFAINKLCGNKFLHNITTEDGVKKALVINMAQVSHMNIVVYN